MSEDEAHLEQIDSDEIKKLVNKIYCSKPEEVIKESNDIDKHIEITKQLDSLEMTKRGFWKKRGKIF